MGILPELLPAKTNSKVVSKKKLFSQPTFPLIFIRQEVLSAVNK